MGFPDYEKDLRNPEVDLELILDKYFHCGESAVFHGAPPDEEPRLKEMVAAAILDTFVLTIAVTGDSSMPTRWRAASRRVCQSAGSFFRMRS